MSDIAHLFAGSQWVNEGVLLDKISHVIGVPSDVMLFFLSGFVASKLRSSTIEIRGVPFGIGAIFGCERLSPLTQWLNDAFCKPICVSPCYKTDTVSSESSRSFSEFVCANVFEMPTPMIICAARTGSTNSRIAGLLQLLNTRVYSTSARATASLDVVRNTVVGMAASITTSGLVEECVYTVFELSYILKEVCWSLRNMDSAAILDVCNDDVSFAMNFMTRWSNHLKYHISVSRRDLTPLIDVVMKLDRNIVYRVHLTTDCRFSHVDPDSVFAAMESMGLGTHIRCSYKQSCRFEKLDAPDSIR